MIRKADGSSPGVPEFNVNYATFRRLATAYPSFEPEIRRVYEVDPSYMEPLDSILDDHNMERTISDVRKEKFLRALGRELLPRDGDGAFFRGLMDWMKEETGRGVLPPYCYVDAAVVLSETREEYRGLTLSEIITTFERHRHSGEIGDGARIENELTTILYGSKYNERRG